MKKVKQSFEKFKASLPVEESKKIDCLLSDWKLHIALNKRDSSKLLNDAKNAIGYLYSSGFSIQEIINLVGSNNLGGFYAHEAVVWYPLDDAAKIYPLSMKNGQVPMFRLSCSLKTKVVPEILQLALDFTLKRFPSFATIVRKGVFWHYLDSVKKRFEVKEETGAPCQSFRINSIGTASFRVLYFNNRISVEFFHVLTDGEGGIVFLKTLVGEYFRILGNTIEYSDCLFDVNRTPSSEETANEFKRLCPKTKGRGGFSGKPALQMSGKLAKHKPVNVVQFTFDTEKLLAKAHSYNASLSAYILALMFKANKAATESIDGVIQMQLPVNMRKYYPSKTLRNFAMYCSIDIPTAEIEEIPFLVGEIKEQISRKTTKEEMSLMMKTAHKIVTSLKLIPLAVKIPFAKLIYGLLGDIRFSNALSNLGVVSMPEAIADKIDSFDFILGTCNVSRASCTLCSYRNKTVFSISKTTKDPSFEEAMYKLLNDEGLEITVTGSPIYD